MNKYYYKAEDWSAKLLIPFSLMIVGILMVLYIPVGNEFTALLISLIYIAGFILLLFDTIPFTFRVFKSRGQGISIDKNSIIFLNKRGSNGVLEESKIDREDILRVELKSHSNGKTIISPENEIREIDDKIHKMSGRRLSIYSNKSGNDFSGNILKMVIYLELLDDKFLTDFIKWYQDKKAGDLP
jgi:hypothetical protein